LSLFIFSCKASPHQKKELTNEPAVVKIKKNTGKFTWNLVNYDTLVYSFIELSDRNLIDNESFFKKTNEVIGEVYINLNSKGDFIIHGKNLENHVLMQDSLGQITKVRDINYTNYNRGTFDKYGHYSKKINHPYFSFIFPLPKYDMEVGDIEEHEYTTTIANVIGLESKGIYTLEFLKIEKRNNRDCAVLKMNMNPTKGNNDSGHDLNLTSKYSGEGTYYFDLENHIFIESYFNIYESTKIEKEINKSNNFEFNLEKEEEYSYHLKLIKDISRDSI
jgi:hypothetical protein